MQKLALLMALASMVGCSTSPEAAPATPPVREIPAQTRVVDGVIDQVVAAYGGPRGLRRLASSRVEGVVMPHIRDMGGEGRLERHVVAPGRLRVKIVYPAKTEVRILDDDRGWRGDGAHMEAVQGPPLLAMRYQLLRLQPAWALSHHRNRVELGADVEHDGRPHRALRLTWSPQLRLDYLVEADTGHITSVTGTLSFGSATLAFATEYSDFEMADGALMPRTEKTIASGRHTATTRIEQIELGASDLGPFSEPGESRH